MGYELPGRSTESVLMPVPIHSSQSAELAFVLDDDARIGSLVCHYLQMCGYESRAFSTPLPFITETKSSPPALIVLDLALGQTDGIEIIRQLEVMRFAGKVLLISGRDTAVLQESERIGRLHGLSMLPSLKKPFRMPELKAILTADSKQPVDQPQQSQPARPRIDVSEAIAKNWLEIWYQPKIDLKGLEVCGAEALLRVRHPEHGIVAPRDFLPPRADPIHERVTKLVMQRALMDSYFFIDERIPLKLSINVPISVLCGSDFVSMVRDLLTHYPRCPGLIAEITEDEIVRDRDAVREVATQLTLYNVSLSIDDFGSAHSRLARLLEVPCVEVKIDTSFVSNCAHDAVKRAICESVVHVAREMGVAVCAEGVENIDDLRALSSIGCNAAQGFLFGHPMPREILVRNIQKADSLK